MTILAFIIFLNMISLFISLNQFSMEQLWFYLITIAIPLFLVVLIRISKNTKLPPSPRSIPIIGHLHLIKDPAHRTLERLSQKYGSVMSLWFGSRRVIIISSPSAFEECFTKNDIVLANRPKFLIGKHLAYNSTTLATSSYGDHWRNLRKFSTQEIFSVARLNSFSCTRHEEVRSLVKKLFLSSQNGFEKVEMKSRLSELSFNIIMGMVAGKRYFGLGGGDFEEAKRFRSFIKVFTELGGMTNPGDFLPFMRLIDYGNLEKKMLGLQKEADLLLQDLVDEHRVENKSGVSLDRERTKTMIDSMLMLQEEDPENFTDDIIKGQILTMIAAGTDTSTITIEWAMSLLLNNPDILSKARAEIDENVPRGHLVHESDLTKLPYLQNIVKETLRLYPSAPLLAPHESSHDCTLEGYTIPRGSMIIVNAWAIHRDPKVWDSPTSFSPERFQGEESEGRAYKLVPFGFGRRQCPGARLASQVVELTLAALIQCFEWNKVKGKIVDMSEGQGITMPKAEPLEAMCKARENMNELLSKIFIKSA